MLINSTSKMLKKQSLPCFLLFTIILVIFSISSRALGRVRASGPVVTKEERRPVVSTEYGEISAVRITDGINGSYLLHFFKLEPSSLLLPVVLHADMVFYVHSGSGKLSWTDEDEVKSMDLRKGDVYRLQQGTVFFIRSDPGTELERQPLKIHSLFTNSNQDLQEPATGPYSSIRDTVVGFGKKVLQSTYKVPEDVIDKLLGGTKSPDIVHADLKTKKRLSEMESRFTSGLIEESSSYDIFESNKKNRKGFNLFEAIKDFKSCDGWSTTVTRKKLPALEGSNIGLFMVNLTTSSMTGPNWNPMATEIAVVLEGRGMVRVVCSDIPKGATCRNTRFEVKGGDVFAVPRFYTKAQMAFDNETFVFMGFSRTSMEKYRAQFLAGKGSVLRTLDRDVLALSFNITNTTLAALLAPRVDSVIVACTSCAEEELAIMEGKEMGQDVPREEEAPATQPEGEKGREQEEQGGSGGSGGGSGGGGGGEGEGGKGKEQEEEQGGRGGGGGEGEGEKGREQEKGQGGHGGGSGEGEEGETGREQEKRQGGHGGGSGEGEGETGREQEEEQGGRGGGSGEREGEKGREQEEGQGGRGGGGGEGEEEEGREQEEEQGGRGGAVVREKEKREESKKKNKEVVVVR